MTWQQHVTALVVLLTGAFFGFAIGYAEGQKNAAEARLDCSVEIANNQELWRSLGRTDVRFAAESCVNAGVPDDQGWMDGAKMRSAVAVCIESLLTSASSSQNRRSP